MNGAKEMPTPDHLGRIRINENEARLLVQLLYVYRTQLLAERRSTMEQEGDTHPWNRELLHIRKIWQEISLLAEQKAWDLEPGPNHEEGADPSPSPVAPGGVGGWDGTGYGSSRRLRGTTTAP